MSCQMLQLGEINDAQLLTWYKIIEVFNNGAQSQAGLFGEGIWPAGYTEAVGVRLSEVQLKHLWQWDAW
jgi:hypothetical protein